MKRLVVRIERVFEVPDDTKLDEAGVVLEGDLIIPDIDWTMRDPDSNHGVGVDGPAWDALVEGEVVDEAKREIELDGEVATWSMRKAFLEEGDDQIGCSARRSR